MTVIVLMLLALVTADGSRRLAPKKDPAGWVGRGDLDQVGGPRPAHRILIHLLVDEKGRADGCTILESSGAAAFDDAVCRAAQKHVTFVPARDAQGQATRSSFNQAIIVT